ncbi:hypothetical protein K1F50_19805 [Muricauda oceani]|uniref:Uncharacterized protein n=1 Tax=Flagellimonas oceani TaxID=2698672 RepID=A0A6G7J2M7_9FLAO|nr:hypothetical protein [Allomuricauda oceani]MBW8245060.1 hypothetical protein [Allomuricauda oceani]QII44868.1 hypothetical protein GVT53_09285 [Allomuricauda oceani]
MDIDEIIEKGYLTSAEEEKWNSTHHSMVMNLIKNNEIKDHCFIRNYSSEKSFTNIDLSIAEKFDILEASIDWYKDFLKSKTKKEQSRFRNVQIYKQAIEFGVLLKKERSTLKEWLKIYETYQTDDFISKKKREKFINFYKDYLNGTFDNEVSNLLDLLKHKKSYKYTNYEIDLILLTKANARLYEVLLIDKKNKTFWAIGKNDYKLYYFDSNSFVKDPFGFQLNFGDDINKLHKKMVRDIDRCSNKLFFWTGKKAINQYIRYHNKIIILFAKSFLDRPGMIIASLSCTLNSIEEDERRIIQVIKNFTANSSSYTNNKAGVIKVGIGFAGWEGPSLYKNHWISEDYKNGLYIEQSFGSEEEAKIKFEERAVQLIKKGKYIFCSSTYDCSIETLEI